METKASNRLLLLAGAFTLSVGAAVIAPPHNGGNVRC